jgi:hypothetical protein
VFSSFLCFAFKDNTRANSDSTRDVKKCHAICAAQTTQHMQHDATCPLGLILLEEGHLMQNIVPQSQSGGKSNDKLSVGFCFDVICCIRIRLIDSGTMDYDS